MPEELSPSERDSFTQSIKDAFGNNEITDTMVDIATNPFVLLSFLVTPPAGKAIKSAGRMFHSSESLNRFLNKNSVAFNILHALRLTSASNQMHGTPGDAVMKEMIDNFNKLQKSELDTFSKPTMDVFDAVEKKTGIRLDTLDPDQISDPAARQVAKEINHAMFVRQAGWDRHAVEFRDVDVTPFLKKDNKIKAIRPNAPEELVDVGRNRAEKLYQERLSINERFDDIETQLAKGEITEEQAYRYKVNHYKMIFKDRTLDPATVDLPWDRMLASRKEGRVYYSHSGNGSGSLVYDFPEHPAKIKDVKVVVNTSTNRGLFSDPEQRARVDSIIDKYELGGYIDAHNKFRDDRLVALFGSEGQYALDGTFKADKQKLLRITSAIVSKNNENFSQGAQALIDDTASALLSDEVLNAIRTNKGIDKELRNQITNTLTEAFEQGLVRDTYVPRNVLKSVDQNRNVLEAMDVYTHKEAANYLVGAETQKRRAAQVQWRQEDLEEMGGLFGYSDELEKEIRTSKAARNNALNKNDRHGEFSINFHDSQRRYSHSSAITHTMHVKMPGEGVYAAINDSLTPSVVKAKGRENFASLRSGETGIKTNLVDLVKRDDVEAVRALEKNLPLGGVSLLDVLEGTIMSIPDTRTQEFVLKSVIPTLVGRKGVNDVVSEAVFKFTQQAVGGLAKSKVGETIAGTGPQGKKLIQQMTNWSDKTEQNIRSGQFGGLSGQTARALYSSHLGLNMGSVMLNMLQPITMGMPLVGVGAAVRGYRDSMKMMTGYVSDRMKMGARITDSQRAELLEKHFTETIELADGTSRRVNFAELADIGLDPFHIVDEASLRSGYKRPAGPAQYWLFEGTMKPFEKAEWFNRVTMAHAAKHVRRRAGKLNTSEDVARMSDEASQLVQKTQFGSDPVNRPEIFYSKYFENPLARQFLQFPLRQITGSLLNPQEMGGSAMKHIIKAMGYSAIAYEVGKNALDMDVSRGLFVGSMTDLVGGDRFFKERDATGSLAGNIAPPALDILVNATQAVGTGDLELLKETIPRMVPGGVAFSRLVGAAGQVPMAAGLQRQYADWSNMKEGQVPVYKADGRLVGNMNASSVVLKALGADMRQYKEPQELNKFLLANREQMKDYRRQWISSVLANNLSEAERVKAEFEGRFKMPLTVSKSQMKNAVKLRESSVVSRVSDTMEKASRTAYQGEVPQNYFERVDSPQVEAETARYIWSTMQGQNPGNPGMTTERQ